MEADSQNEGDFDVINALGKGANKPATKAEVERPVDEDEGLEELQRRYLWECTFREVF